MSEKLREKRKKAIKALNDIKIILELDEQYIDELEDKLANADYQLEGRDNEIEGLEKKVCKLEFALENKNADYDTLETRCNELFLQTCEQAELIESLKILNKANVNLEQAEKIKELEKELADAKKVQVVEHFEAYGQCRDSRRIAALEAQIEKMKCCFNCKHSRTEYEHCRTDKHEKWEIKENDRQRN